MSADYWQQQDNEERMALELEALRKVDRAGLHDEAEFLAAELGLKTQFNQEKEQCPRFPK